MCTKVHLLSKKNTITAIWTQIVGQTSVATAKDVAEGEEGVVDGVSRVTIIGPTGRLLYKLIQFRALLTKPKGYRA